MNPSPPPLPTDLHEAQQKVDRWRAGNARRRRIPESFWLRAAELARGHGVNRVAQSMRLSHRRLKARVEASAVNSIAPAPVRFVELDGAGPALGAPTPLTIEIDDGSGRRMQVTGADTHSAMQLLTTLFGAPAS